MTSGALTCFCISQRNFKLIILDRNRKERLVKDCTIFEMFGEKALMESRPRAASIMQTTEIVVLQLSREEFERQLRSPMSQFQAQQYNLDPWKLLVDFYRKVDANEPMGRLPASAAPLGATAAPSSWYVVYRSCS